MLTYTGMKLESSSLKCDFLNVSLSFLRVFYLSHVKAKKK